MDSNLIYALIVIFWVWSLETIYMEAKHHKDYLSYTNVKREKILYDKQVKYLYINLYLYLSQ